ncbi:protein DCL, chloroplastic [Cornus florida]|uniref:protein DCL, chloroplastic n=1 Tax=Cornus florida TaxID=4283 RepID=UPI00289D1DE9|nr:protein DCL, chloroplastic [Cornus florida]XP_059633850.1 protein DCL, chloroplastic [Cornus florida]XP_059633851.1 protein DCL, chloroplastic [Cornus florida]
MASISSTSPHIHIHRNPISLHLLLSSSNSLSFPSYRSRLRSCALKSGGEIRSSSQDAYNSELLRKPVVSPPVDSSSEDLTKVSDDDEEEEEEEEERREEEGWVDWEDQILEDTVPLVGFVRMILHSGKYGSGDRLSPEHEKTILEKLLPYHPECEKKIGCGVDYITVGYHPNFESSRCMFIVRTDGELVDFSYWKCIKGLIRKNYPLYADSFILRHFRRRRRSE